MRPSRAVLLLAAALFLWNIWGYDVWAPDEPYFAEGAREMVADGRWAVPHVNGVVTTDKPPLFFWLIAVLSLPLGQVTSLTARLPSVLAMLGAVILTIRLARRLSGGTVSALAGAVFVTTYLVWDKGRTAQIDALLCFLVLAAVSAFEEFRAGDASGRRAGMLFWTLAGLAVLAKGPVGFLVPLGIVLLTLAADGNLGSFRRFAPAAGPALFLAIVAAWMALATLGGHGEYSVWGAIRQHVIDRAVHGMHHRQPFWYYATVLPVQLLPWSGLVPAALVLAWRRRDEADRFLLSWVVFVVAFFSIPAEKRDLYVLPSYPAFAILLARLVAGLDEGTARISRRWATLPHGLVAVALILAGVAVPVAATRTGAVPLGSALFPAGALAITGAVVLAVCVAGRLRLAVIATVTGTAVAYLAVATFVLPPLDAIKSARGFSLVLAAETAASRSAGHEVLAFDVGNLPEAFAFFTRGLYTEETGDPSVLAKHLSQSDRVFAVADERRLEVLPEALRARVVIVHRQELSRIPVVLVANR